MRLLVISWIAPLWGVALSRWGYEIWEVYKMKKEEEEEEWSEELEECRRYKERVKCEEDLKRI
jgi:hypothetical protein